MNAETGHLEPSTSMVPPETEGFLRELARRLEDAANAKTIFAAPIERDGATIVPIAKARWGMGGGPGVRPGGAGSPARGPGGGGGAMVSPIGYIELRNGMSKFRPIRDPARTLPLLIAAGITA